MEPPSFFCGERVWVVRGRWVGFIAGAGKYRGLSTAPNDEAVWLRSR